MGKDIEYKVRVRGADGAEYLLTYQGLWNRLQKCRTFDEKFGWNKVTRAMRKDVNKLRDLFLSEILFPQAKQAILSFLKEHPNVQTRNFHDKKWVGLRANAWYYAQEQLEAEGKIVSESHGRGKNRTWKLKES